jgi:hypothetical protein
VARVAAARYGRPGCLIKQAAPHSEDHYRGSIVDAGEAFVVEGFVGGHRIVARWIRGVLSAPAALLSRADAVVARGDHIRHAGALVPASVDQSPLLALVTLIRAFDLVTSVDIADWISDGVPPTCETATGAR